MGSRQTKITSDFFFKSLKINLHILLTHYLFIYLFFKAETNAP